MPLREELTVVFVPDIAKCAVHQRAIVVPDALRLSLHENRKVLAPRGSLQHFQVAYEYSLELRTVKSQIWTPMRLCLGQNTIAITQVGNRGRRNVGGVFQV